MSHGDNYCINFRIPLCYYSFAASLSTYLESCRENDDLVAIHCTHGLNRTGYLVCR
jgi:protein-tyrosine phosphatase